MRSLIQQFPTISFVFSGSNKHMLETMFTSTSRPFFGSADIMNLDLIPSESYSSFIISHFKSGGLDIKKEDVYEILQWCRSHTYYVQYFCNRLYATGNTNIDNDTLNKVKLEILESFTPAFITYRKLLTKPQYDLLQAIAVEKGISQPHAGGFIEKYKLKISSTVKASLDSLVKKEMIVYHNNAWQVYDVFMMRWLEYQWLRSADPKL